MKKSLLIIIGLLIITAIFGVSKYNHFVTAEETVDEKWSQVQNVYQRRLDLIPNLVSTVKGYATHEKATLEAVIKARSSATKLTKEALSGVLNDPAAFQKFNQAQGALSSALSKLMVVVERYPELKANKGFLNLQSQLEGSENRIAVERKRFNEAVKDYNTSVRKFPGKLFAALFGFEKKNMFTADKKAQKVPEVKF
mgnify:CR=1 FL=1